MATPKKAAPPRTRTRKEVKDDFETLKEAVEDAAPADPKMAQLAKQRAVAVQAKTAQVTPEAVVGQIGQVTLDIQKTLADVQSQILERLNLLSELNETIDVQKGEVERIHNIDTAQSAIDVLIQEYEEKLTTLEKEYAEKAAALERVIQARVEEEARTTTEAQSLHEREDAEYIYKTKLARRKAEDEFAQKQQLLERGLNEKREALEKQWAERDAVLKLAEKELIEHRAIVAGLPEAIRKEKEAAVAIATNSLKKDLTAQFALEKKDLEQKIALGNQATLALQTQSESQAKRIGLLEAELERSRESVKEMAVASFKEAGASRALAEVTSFGQSRDAGNSTRSKS